MNGSGTEQPSLPRTLPGAVKLGVLFTLVAIGALVTWKASTAMGAIAQAEQTGALAPKVGLVAPGALPGWAQPIAATINYFAWVMIALAFGVVIGAAVKVLIPERWLVQSVGRDGFRGHLWAAATGAPLMLCSCCVTPIFEGVYAKTRRLGPALALMFAAPALNPMAHLLTFAIFPLRVAVARLVLSIGLVLIGSVGLSRVLGADRNVDSSCDVGAPEQPARLGLAFGAALWDTARKSLPAVLVGVLASALVMQFVPLPSLARPDQWLLPVSFVAALATVIALPTFGEIPLALALHAAGLPEAAGGRAAGRRTGDQRPFAAGARAAGFAAERAGHRGGGIRAVGGLVAASS